MKRRTCCYAMVRRWNIGNIGTATGSRGEEAVGGGTGETEGRLGFGCLFIYSIVCH